MGNPQVFLFFVPGKLMAALAYRDDKILARKLLSHPFFCLTPAEPFFRPDRSLTAPSCRVAVKDGRAFRGHPKGLSLTTARAMARWRSRGGRHAWQQSTARHHGDRRGFPVPVPASLQKSGNSYREVHRLSRFRDHRTAWSCLFVTAGDPVALGLVAGLNRPGANLTGMAILAAELAPKQLQLLHELIPDAARFGVLVNPTKRQNS